MESEKEIKKSRIREKLKMSFGGKKPPEFNKWRGNSDRGKKQNNKWNFF